MNSAQPEIAELYEAKNGDVRLDGTIGGIQEILPRTQDPLRCLNRCMIEEQLDLPKLAASRPTQLRACPSQIVRHDSGNSGFAGIRLRD